jgi:hypothetical protein
MRVDQLVNVEGVFRLPHTPKGLRDAIPRSPDQLLILRSNQQAAVSGGSRKIRKDRMKLINLNLLIPKSAFLVFHFADV